MESCEVCETISGFFCLYDHGQKRLSTAAWYVSTQNSTRNTSSHQTFLPCFVFCFACPKVFPKRSFWCGVIEYLVSQ